MTVFLQIFPCVSVPSAVCLCDNGAKRQARSDAERRSQAASLLQMQDRDPLPAAGIRMAPSSQREVAKDRHHGSAAVSSAPAWVESAPVNMQSAVI